MRTLTATEVKTRLGQALSFADDESLLVEKNGKPAFMAFSAATGRHMVLSTYALGQMSRSKAMHLLGLTWYGDLLAALAEAKLTCPRLEQAEVTPMIAHACQLLKSA